MGRDTSGVAGMKLRGEDEVIEVDIAVDDADLLVVTENGYGKRTRVGDYPTKGRGTMGVKTAQLTEGKGRLAGARIVREGYQVMLISTGGTIIRMPADGIKRSGRATQGVIVMRLREGEQVATLGRGPALLPAERLHGDPPRGQRGDRRAHLRAEAALRIEIDAVEAVARHLVDELGVVVPGPDPDGIGSEGLGLGGAGGVRGGEGQRGSGDENREREGWKHGLWH